MSLRKLWLAALLLAPLWACAADAAAPEVLPFVAASGIVERPIKYSDVVRAFGEPATDVTQPVSYSNGKRGGENRVLNYPAKGLTFVIERDARKQLDPVVSSMTVTKPGKVSLPNGLAMGMRLADARPIIQRNYHFEYEGKGSQPWMSLIARQSNSHRTLQLSFSDGVLSFMAFETLDPPSFLVRALRWVAGLIPVLLLCGVAYVIWRVRGGEEGEREREEAGTGVVGYVFAGLLVVGGMVALGIGVGTFKDSNPYVAMLGLLTLIMGLGGFFFAALVLSRARNRIVSGLASAVVLGVIALSVWARFSH